MRTSNPVSITSLALWTQTRYSAVKETLPQTSYMLLGYHWRKCSSTATSGENKKNRSSKKQNAGSCFENCTTHPKKKRVSAKWSHLRRDLRSRGYSLACTVAVVVVRRGLKRGKVLVHSHNQKRSSHALIRMFEEKIRRHHNKFGDITTNCTTFCVSFLELIYLL